MISGFWRNVSRIIWKVYNKFFLSKQILEIFENLIFRIEEIIYKFIIMVMLICAGVLLNLIKEKKIIII